ncbi:hypothetical protein F4806DRAFT_470955 [Annulohypoxylon nitens]|nr:hypothetical protein F4806DRAFT_470955 [Annulohypoxylon nitens]
MECFQQRARDRWLRRVENDSPECEVQEISGSGNDISHSKKTMRVDEAQAYVQAASDQPIFKLVQFKAGIWKRPRAEQYADFVWVIDVLAELGADAYSMESSLGTVGCNMMEQNLGERGKVLITVVETYFTYTIATYSYATRSTMCFVFSRIDNDSTMQLKYMDDFVMQNARLYQNTCFISLFFADLILNYIEEFLPVYEHKNFDNNDEDNLHEWELLRRNTRLIQRDFFGLDDVIICLRARIDADTERGSSCKLPQDIVNVNVELEEVFIMMEKRISVIKRQLEWDHECANDFLDKVSRALLREDTMASIGLSKTGVQLSKDSVELTKATKVDSSSMKVIAVMTMVFLPGTFFAALFAVPSLDWKGDDVVGKNFWMYWAFTIPFTLLVIVLWLMITQRKQMRDAFETSKKQWSDKTKALQDRLRRRKPTADEEEVEMNEVGQEGSGEEGRQVSG